MNRIFDIALALLLLCSSAFAQTTTLRPGASQGVTGPASSTSDDIATFNGTTGKKVKDSGTKVSDLTAATTFGVCHNPDGTIKDSCKGAGSAKLNRWIDAKADYGINCDGSDETSKFNTLIAALTSGTNVLLPPGTCGISSGLTIGNGTNIAQGTLNNINLIGAGSNFSRTGGTVIKWVGSAGAYTMLTLAGPADGLGFQGISFYADNKAQNAVVIYSDHVASFSDFEIRDFTGTGLTVTTRIGALVASYCMYNTFDRFVIQSLNSGQAVTGILLDGDYTNQNDCWQIKFSNGASQVRNPTVGTSYALHAKFVDSSIFEQVELYTYAAGTGSTFGGYGAWFDGTDNTYYPVNLMFNACTISSTTVTGTIQNNYFHEFKTRDNEVIPTDSHLIGVTDQGVSFNGGIATVSTTNPGLCPTLPNDATQFLNGAGTWSSDLSIDTLGIATTVPQAPLHVNRASALGVLADPGTALYSVSTGIVGSTQDNSFDLDLTVADGTGTAGYRGVIRGVRARGTLVSPTVPSANDYVLTMTGGVYDGGAVINTADIGFLVDGTVSSGVAPQRIAFRTRSGGTYSNPYTEWLTIKNDGKVGINQPSPSYTLDVNGTINASSGFNGNASSASVATQVTVTQDNITNGNYYLLFSGGYTGNNGAFASSNLKYNPSLNKVYADISGNAATATSASSVANGVYTTGSYADPSWITSLASSKISGTIDANTGLSGTTLNSGVVNSSLTSVGNLGTLTVQTGGTNTATNSYINNYSAATGYPPSLVFQASGSDTIGTNTATVDGKIIANIIGKGNSGSGFTNGGKIQLTQEGSAGTYTPTRFTVWTSDGTNLWTEKFRITPDGRLRVSNHPAAPANNATCTAGDMIPDEANGRLYICVSTNSWQRFQAVTY